MPIREAKAHKDRVKPMAHNMEDRSGDPRAQDLWKEFKAFDKADWCCEFFKELGIEWLQCETWDFRFHKIRFNYCPHCGRRI